MSAVFSARRQSDTAIRSQYTPPAVPGTTAPQTVYTYNLDRQLERITRPDGQSIDPEYDPVTGQLTSLAIPRGTYAYGYDPVTGKLQTLTAPDTGTLTLSYDGFLATGQTWSGTMAGSVSDAYDNDLNVQSRSVNGANAVAFAYDDDDLLIQAGALALERHPQHGLIEATTLGSLTTSRTYTGFAELDTETARYAATALYSVDYERDAIGRITTKTETVEGITTTVEYRYDAAGRLDQVTTDGQVTAAWTYDANGNRLTAAENGQPPVTGTYDAQDRLTAYANLTYTYTDNGELLTKTDTVTGETTAYAYDVLGNLISVTLPDTTLIEYVIDGRNRRIGKRVNGTLVQGLLYKDQLNPVAELDGSGNVVSRFVYADKVNVPAYMIRNGTTYRIVSDHLGSPRLVVDTADGTIAQRMDYDAWGNVLSDTNPGFQPFGFAGGILDRDTGLVRFGARDYDPETGRWTSKDPVYFQGETTMYGYALLDPVSFVDNNGLTSVPVAAGFFTVAFIVGAYDGYQLGNSIRNSIERNATATETYNQIAPTMQGISARVLVALAYALTGQGNLGLYGYGFGFFVGMSIKNAVGDELREPPSSGCSISPSESRQ